MCSWCVNPNAEEDDGTLCRPHKAEYEGLSLGQMDKRDVIERDEMVDAGIVGYTYPTGGVWID